MKTALPAAKTKTLCVLFFSIFRMSACTFGGGYVIATLLKKRFVDELHWLSEEEMLDLIALAGSVPGPVAVNISVLAGWRIAGLSGIAAGVIAVIIPPVTILTAISFFYEAVAQNRYAGQLLSGMLIGAAAVIMDAVCSMGIEIIRRGTKLQAVIILLCFAASFFAGMNPFYIIAFTAAAAVLQAFCFCSNRKDSSKEDKP